MSVAVVCKSALLRQMLVAACEDLNIGPVQSGEAVTELDGLSGETVVLLHTDDKSRDASAALGQISANGEHPKVIVLCASDALSHMVREIGGRVSAIIPDNYPAETLTAAIRLVALGFRIFHESHARDVKHSTLLPYANSVSRGTQQSVDAYSLLTKREVAILARLRAGLENKSIAQELGVSEATVKVHLRAIYRKTGVRNRTQAALWGSDHL